MFSRNREYLEKIAEVRGFPSMNPLSLAAVQAAFTSCDMWLDELNAYLDSNFELFYRLCRKHFPKAVITKTEGTYLAWVDVRAYTDDTKALEEKLLNDYHVYIECGDAFRGKGFIRVNLACPKKYIEEAFARVQNII